MPDLATALQDSDLAFLIRTLIPDCRDIPQMMRTLREDEEILEGMLEDERLFRILTDDPDALVRISPRLFFSVLLSRVRRDLKGRSYTVERDQRHPVLVFDSNSVVQLLDVPEMRRYLADMLASFVRINTYIIPIRVRKGTWRKLRISDTDIDSLINYSQTLDEAHRFHAYKRIADVCLFISGIFHDYLKSVEGIPPGFQLRKSLSGRSREGYEEEGRRFYRAASEHRAAQVSDMDRILLDLSEKFALAVKSLVFLSDNYLDFHKDQLFLH
jgi:hypothetical protein